MASNYGYTNPFSVCFTSMKLRYHDYDSSIESLNFVQPTDSVNVFISFESVLNNLSTIQDIDNKLLLERNFPTILEAEMINLCAHYKKFFKGNGLNTKVFLYYTDLSSEDFIEFKHNDEYRSFYTNKFLRNPKFQLLGKRIVDTIVPRVATIMEYIPDVYFISGKNIEGSLIPWVIAKQFPKSKNFIITTDKYETQYLFYPQQFCLHYIKKSRLGGSVIYSYDKYISDIFKEEHENNPNVALFQNPSFYDLIIASLGDKIRSIDSLKGIGCKTVNKFIINGINQGKITQETTSLELLKSIFPEEYQEDLIHNFNCVNLALHFNDLTETQIFDITNQIVDKSDYNSLIQLNQRDYKEYPLMLQELTC